MRHNCPFYSACRKNLPGHLLMCGAHWKLCPKALRDAVNDAWEKYRNLPVSASVELRAARREQLRHAQDEAVRAVEEKLAAKAGAR